MTKDQQSLKTWNEIYREISGLEEHLIRIQPTVAMCKNADLDHLMQIATGNIRKVRAWIIQNQAKILYRLRVAKSHKKGGDSID